jgi:hypothetical protein
MKHIIILALYIYELMSFISLLVKTSMVMFHLISYERQRLNLTYFDHPTTARNVCTISIRHIPVEKQQQNSYFWF